jgi:hypothetical protein
LYTPHSPGTSREPLDKSSTTDPAQPEDGSAGVNADRHASFQRASDEIESLWTGVESLPRGQ